MGGPAMPAMAKKNDRSRARRPGQTEFFVYSQSMFFVWCVERESDSLLDPPESAKLFPNNNLGICNIDKKFSYVVVLSLFI